MMFWHRRLYLASGLRGPGRVLCLPRVYHQLVALVRPFLLTICLLVVGAAWDLSLGDIAGGGMIGGTLHSNSSYYLSPGGSGLVWFFIFLVGVQLTFNFSWVSVGALCVARIRERILQKNRKKSTSPRSSLTVRSLPPCLSISVSSPV